MLLQVVEVEGIAKVEAARLSVRVAFLLIQHLISLKQELIAGEEMVKEVMMPIQILQMVP